MILLVLTYVQTDRDSLERLFNPQQQQGGVFKKVTEEQIKQLTGRDEVQVWPFGQKKGHNKGPYNIYKNKPSVANENGVLYEVDSDDFNGLREINVAFSLYNITQVRLFFRPLLLGTKCTKLRN